MQSGTGEVYVLHLKTDAECVFKCAIHGLSTTFALRSCCINETHKQTNKNEIRLYYKTLLFILRWVWSR